MRLVVQRQGAKIAELTAADEPVFIGARDDCAIRLTGEGFGEQHAAIVPESQSEWVLEQLSPGVDVVLNGIEIIGKVCLKSGDEIQIGETTIHTYLEPVGRPREGTSTSVASLTRFAQFQLPPGTIVRRTDEPITLMPAQLTRIGQSNVTLSSCETAEALMDVAVKSLFEALPAQRAWLGLRRMNYGAMEYVQGQHVNGATAELHPVGEKLKPRVLDRGQNLLIPVVSLEEPISVLAGPLPGPDGVLGMVYLDTGDSGRRFEPHDLDFFLVLVNALGAQLHAIFQQVARTRAATLDGEVAVVHAVQARLTPRKLPQSEQLQFGAFREPGRQRSTDIYDIVKLPNDMVTFMMAHTSATGPLPAMLMAQAQAAFRTAAMHLDRPAIFLRTLNVLLYDGVNDHPLELITGVINPSTGKMVYAMAGSAGAFIISNRGEERRLAPPRPTPPVGVNKNAAYEDLSEQLGPGETLVLFTPGVVTAKNSAGVVFGEERFINILCDGFGQLASNMLKEMLSDLRSFTEGGQQPFDITVILAHRVA